MMFAQYDQKVSNDMERKKEEQSHLKRNNQGSAKAKEKKAKTTPGIPQMAVQYHSEINPMARKDKGCKTMIPS
jgi:hypothetical protein